MKNYEVTLLLVINASSDVELEEPETFGVSHVVSAESEEEAIRIAKELEDSKLSVWESWADEM